MNFLKIKSIVLSSLVFLTVGITRAQAQPSRFSFNTYVHTGDTLRYRMLSPDYNILRKYPLVIFLHGSGERGNDNDAQLKWGVMNFASDQVMSLHPSFVVAPQCPENLSWSDFNSDENNGNIRLQPSPSKPMRLLIDLIHALIKEYPVDTTRIYITGLSMGGFGAFDAMERYPHLFAAAVPVCGGGDTSKASLIAHIPTWIFHGAEDPAVNPRYSTDMLAALMRAGVHPGFTLYPEGGHFAWLAAYADLLMMEWLFRQHK